MGKLDYISTYMCYYHDCMTGNSRDINVWLNSDWYAEEDIDIAAFLANKWWEKASSVSIWRKEMNVSLKNSLWYEILITSFH